MDLDPELARAFFLSPEVFRADSPILHAAVAALLDGETQVDRARLHVLITDLAKTDLAWPRNYALGSALRLLGQQMDLADTELLNHWMDHADEYAAEGAASGLLKLHRLEDYEDAIDQKTLEGNMESLSAPQRHCYGVSVCDGEVDNGGLAQYFDNAGELWQDSLAGYAAIGAKEKHAILQEAVAMFGPEGPHKEWEQRGKQLEKLWAEVDQKHADKKEDERPHLFEDLDNRYYDSKENVKVLTTRYVIANKAAFAEKKRE